MKNNVYIKNEAFDTDEIEYIEFRNPKTIYLKKTNNGSRMYMDSDNHSEALKEFEQIMQIYNDAVDKRKKGEKSELELEMERRMNELQESRRLYYGDDSDNEIDKEKEIKPETVKKYEQESLF